MIKKKRETGTVVDSGYGGTAVLNNGALEITKHPLIHFPNSHVPTPENPLVFNQRDPAALSFRPAACRLATMIWSRNFCTSTAHRCRFGKSA